MDLLLSLAVVGAAVVGGIVTLLALVVVLVVCVRSWRMFTQWVAKSDIAKERRRAKLLLDRQQKLAAEREEAMLRGASTVASQLVQSVVDAQLRHLVARENEHRQQLFQLMQAIANHQPAATAVLDVESPSDFAALKSLSPPSVTKSSQRGMLSSLRRMLFADATVG